ncbi:MAG: methyltransferase domain-containing protein [Alphaproteobacteria bacterium]
MFPDIATFYDWYATPQGRMVAGIVREVLANLCAPKNGQRVLVVGFAAPYVLPEGSLLQGVEVVWAQPAAMGAVVWPDAGPCQSVMVWERQLPFAEHTFDHVVVLHALEYAEGAAPMVAECARVLKAGGHLLAMVPHRTGGWARWETSPFALGNPYSKGQLRRVVEDANLRMVHLQGALYVPPFAWPWLMKTAPMWEKMRLCCAPLAGVLVAQARKDVLGGRAVRTTAKPLRTQAVLRPLAG